MIYLIRPCVVVPRRAICPCKQISLHNTSKVSACACARTHTCMSNVSACARARACTSNNAADRDRTLPGFRSNKIKNKNVLVKKTLPPSFPPFMNFPLVHPSSLPFAQLSPSASLCSNETQT